ncbi:MAG: hypothetical protein FWC68_06410, partial [Oscillospiraceae bacterium]|nr:hypothetical protein [Oscillospiraceae bacterium]
GFLGSYTELSLSCTGYHIICKVDMSQLLEEKEYKRLYYTNNLNGIELYIGGIHNKYMTYTGDVSGEIINEYVSGQEWLIEDRTDEILEILDEHMKKENPKPHYEDSNIKIERYWDYKEVPDEEIIKLARKAKGKDKNNTTGLTNGKLFAELYDKGNISLYRHNNGEPDTSRADLVLIQILAFWTRGNAVQVDRIYRSSALYRSKWEREDYVENTISLAISTQINCGAFYKGKGIKKPKPTEVEDKNRTKTEDKNNTKAEDIEGVEIMDNTVNGNSIVIFEEKLQSVNGIVPDRHIKPNNKLSNQITRNMINEGEIPLRVSGAKQKNKVITKVTISSKNNYKIELYDREVCDAVATLYHADNEIITPAMVWRAMNGLTGSETVSDKPTKEVIESIDKCREILVKIDYIQESEMYGRDIAEATKKGYIEGYLLACDKVALSVGGHMVEGYIMLRKPITYSYAQVSRQIVNVPVKLLNTKKSNRNNNDMMILRGQLLRRVEQIKHQNSKVSKNKGEVNNKISYYSDKKNKENIGIFELLQVTEANYTEAMYKKRKSTIRKQTEAILRDWVEQGYIKGFEMYKVGKVHKGVKVFV